jgi:uncharacterized protein (DUF697 family)
MARKVSVGSAISTITSVVDVVREMSLEDIRRNAETTPNVVVVADDEESAATIAHGLFGTDTAEHVTVVAPGDPRILVADVVILATPGMVEAVGEVVDVARSGSAIDVHGTHSKLAELPSEVAIALARLHPTLRPVVSRHIISSTSRANAQFALVSSASTAVPVIGNLVAAGADVIVLTKNQLLMVYKLAAVHGRDLDSRSSLLLEMAPVIGAGLGWRALARAAVTMLPAMLGAVPKTAIAWTGTAAAGSAAHVYYTTGKGRLPVALSRGIGLVQLTGRRAVAAAQAAAQRRRARNSDADANVEPSAGTVQS